MLALMNVDPFATKGTEYILVIVFLAALLIYWKLLNSARPAQAGIGPRAVADLSPTPWFSLPAERYYHTGHCWVVPEGDEVVRVGMDDFAQKLLGRPRSLHLPGIGARVGQGEPGPRVDIESRAFDMLSPVDGEVIERNEEAMSSPWLVNDDPYGRGWLLKIRAPRLKANLSSLLSGDLARAWMGVTDHRLRRLMSAGTPGLVMQDGGVPVSGIVRSLAPEHWDEVARDFLLNG